MIKIKELSEAWYKDLQTIANKNGIFTKKQDKYTKKYIYTSDKYVIKDEKVYNKKSCTEAKNHNLDDIGLDNTLDYLGKNTAFEGLWDFMVYYNDPDKENYFDVLKDMQLDYTQTIIISNTALVSEGRIVGNRKEKELRSYPLIVDKVPNLSKVKKVITKLLNNRSYHGK